MKPESIDAPFNMQPVSAKPATRTLVFHYHLFKNAGTSLDEILRINFGKRWIEHEFELPSPANEEAVADFLRTRNELLALSSHTALLPPPRIDGLDIFSIVFVRHPVDRLRSAYEFERTQQVDTMGARLAKAHDFGGYLRELLKNKYFRQARNFQTCRLARNEPVEAGVERERALRALDRLSFVGLVEAYDRSIASLERLLKPHFPDFKTVIVHKNVMLSRRPTLEQRLDAIKSDLGQDFYDELCAQNADDLAIYDALKRKYECPSIP